MTKLLFRWGYRIWLFKLVSWSARENWRDIHRKYNKNIIVTFHSSPNIILRLTGDFILLSCLTLFIVMIRNILKSLLSDCFFSCVLRQYLCVKIWVSFIECQVFWGGVIPYVYLLSITQEFGTEKLRRAWTTTEANPHDMEAWSLIIRDAQNRSIESARGIFERLVTTFPTTGKFWKMYIEQEVSEWRRKCYD